VAYDIHKPLDLPDYHSVSDEMASSMIETGKFLREVIKRNPNTFRIFSPDEMESNKLGAVFEVTHRNFQVREFFEFVIT